MILTHQLMREMVILKVSEIGKMYMSMQLIFQWNMRTRLFSKIQAVVTLGVIWFTYLCLLGKAASYLSHVVLL